MCKKYLPRAALTALLFSFVLIGCDLLNNKPEVDVEQAMDAEIAWANAPYVPVRVEEGGLGTASPRGALDDAVKMSIYSSRVQSSASFV